MNIKIKTKIRVFAVIAVIFTALCFASCKNKQAGDLSAALTIDCTRVADRLDEEIAPKDGYILKDYVVNFSEGDTLIRVFEDAVKENKLQYENNDSYISGISNIYAGDFGELSGWLYYVNGEIPDVGANDYILDDGDEIAFVYFDDYNDAFVE